MRAHQRRIAPHFRPADVQLFRRDRRVPIVPSADVGTVHRESADGRVHHGTHGGRQTIAFVPIGVLIAGPLRGNKSLRAGIAGTRIEQVIVAQHAARRALHRRAVHHGIRIPHRKPFLPVVKDGIGRDRLGVIRHHGVDAASVERFCDDRLMPCRRLRIGVIDDCSDAVKDALMVGQPQPIANEIPLTDAFTMCRGACVHVRKMPDVHAISIGASRLDERIDVRPPFF